MATENILLKFTSDLSGLKSASEELVKMGKLTEEDKRKFDTLLGTVEGIDDALKEAGIEASKFSKEVSKGADSGKTLRTQLAEAKNEAVRLSGAFGPFSKEAREAAKRAAALKDELGDMNDVLDALNPDAKLNAFVKLGQGVQGAFQVATGALQVFGVENERITKIAQQFQGVLNVTQGINSILQLKDVYTQLRLVLGITTTAQTALGAATATTAVATEGATAATVEFSAALTATGIGAIVVALGALVLAFVAVEKSIDDAAFEADQFKKKMDDLEAASKTYGVTFNKLLDERIDKLDFEIKKAEARNASEKEILQLRVQRFTIEQQALDRAISSGKATVEQEDEMIKRRQKNGQELELLQIKLNTILATEKEIARVAKEQSLGNVKAANILPSPQQVEKDLQDLFDVVGTSITKLSTDLPKLPFFTAAEKKQNLENISSFVSNAADLTQGLYDINKSLSDREVADLEKKKEQGIITEQIYQQELKKIKQKAAEDDKKAAVFAAILNAAGAIINALNTQPASAVIPAVAFASITSALNLAKIIAAPVPSFKKGTLNFKGGNVDADGGRLAVLHPSEAVIPADRNMAYHPTIKAIFNKQIKASEINSFVEARLRGKIENRVNASIDVNKLTKAMSKNKMIEIGNAELLGDIIAEKLSQNMNRRQW